MKVERGMGLCCDQSGHEMSRNVSMCDAISLRWQMFDIFKFRQIRGKESARVVNMRHRGLGSLA